MHDVFEVGSLIVEQAKKKLGDNLALVVYYGSQIRGDAKPDSDLDMFYVPVQETGPHLTILFEDKCFDLYPVSWERLNERANYDDYLTSCVHFSRVVYSRSPEDLERFQKLKDRIVELQKPEFKSHMVAKAQGIFQKASYHYFLIGLIDHGDLTATKMQAWEIVKILVHSIAVLNQTVCPGSPGASLKVISELPICPANLIDAAERIIHSHDPDEISSECFGLMKRLRVLLIEEHAKIQTGATFQEVFTSAYPEIREQFVKIARACSNRDSLRAFSASVQIQHGIAIFLGRASDGIQYTRFHHYGEFKPAYESHKLPNLLESIERDDFESLEEDVNELDKGIQSLLQDQSVGLNVLESIDDLDKDYWSHSR